MTGMTDRNRSLSMQIIAILVTVTTIILSIYAVSTVMIYRERETNKLNEHLNILGEQLQTAIASALWNYDNTQLNKVLDGGMKDDTLSGIIVSDNSNVFARSRDNQWNPVAQLPTINKDTITHKLPIVFSDRKLGTLTLHATTRFLKKELITSSIFFIGSILLLELLLVLSFYRFLAITIIDPLTQLKTYALSVSQSETEITPLADGVFRGEMEILRSSLASMVSLLQTRYDELQHEVRRFKESERRFRILVNTIPDLIWLKNTEGVYLSCNNMFTKLCGAAEEDIIGNTDYDFFDTELADYFRQNDQKALEAGRTHVNEELVRFASDGQQALLETTKVPMYDSDGQLVGVLGVARDITERKKAADELDKYKDHLEVLVKERTAQLEEAIRSLSLARNAADSANRAKSMFLANMSHEIRTPMNAVLGFAQLLARDTSLSEQSRESVLTIMKSGEHLLSIINDILEMSRIEAGRVELREQPTNIQKLVNDVATLFRLKAEEKGLAFNIEISANIPSCIVTDTGKVRQVLVNLFGNAVKFTPTGSIVVRVRTNEIDKIIIEVEDTGIGITPDEQAKLFQPFERSLRGEQTAGGTGLGLAISKEYAQLLGGNISLKSEENVGSCFCFEFNAPVTSILPEEERKHSNVTKLAPDQGEIRVLVVDDIALNRQLLRSLLQPMGFVVNEANDGKSAIEIVRDTSPRVVLMDRVMPEMDGIEATRILRQTYSSDVLIIIGISASAFEEDKREFIQAGAQMHIAKPFREEELFGGLSEYAGLKFEYQESPAQKRGTNGTLPNLDKMTEEWKGAFNVARTQKNITKLRMLANEISSTDKDLSEWILEMIGRYDFKELMKL